MLSTDDDLPPAELRAIRAHLRRCATCREQIDEVSAMIARVALSWPSGEHNLDANTAPTAVPKQIAARIGTRRSRWRAAGDMWLRCTRHRLMRIAAVAALLAVIGNGLLQYFTPVARAEALLDRAISYEREQARELRARKPRVRIGFTAASTDAATGSSARVIDLSDDPARRVASAASAMDGHGTHITAILARHEFDWQRPLSVAWFQTWRASLTWKQDYTFERDGLLGLRTTTRQRDIVETEMMVRSDTYEVVRLTLDFHAIGRLQIEESTKPADEPLANPGLTTHSSVPSPPHRDTLEEAELDARLALVGLDVRDAVRIFATPTAVHVDGFIASEARHRRFQDLLADVPYVDDRLRLGLGAIVAVPTELPENMTIWLETRFSYPEMRQSYVRSLVEGSAAIRQRTTILNELARRYPRSEIATLSERACMKLHRLHIAHFRALERDLWSFDHRGTLLWLARARPYSARVIPNDWSHRIDAATEQAKTVDRELRDLLTSRKPGHDSSFEAQVTRLAEAFDQLWNMVYDPGSSAVRD